MFGIDGQEFLVIIIILIVVVGPKDLPKMLRAFGKATARMRTTAQEFRHQFDEAMREVEMGELTDTLSEIKKLDPRSKLTQILDPIRSATDDLQTEIHKVSTLQNTQVQEKGAHLVETAEQEAAGIPVAVESDDDGEKKTPLAKITEKPAGKGLEA